MAFLKLDRIFEIIRLAVMAGAVMLLALTVSAQAQTYNVVHSFTGPDGAAPYAGLTMDRAGNLYGTTTQGGNGHGTVFKLAREGSSWILTKLYSFGGGSDGATPYARVILGSDGTLYGTTAGGGGGACSGGCGTVFHLRPSHLLYADRSPVRGPKPYSTGSLEAVTEPLPCSETWFSTRRATSMARQRRAASRPVTALPSAAAELSSS